MDEVRIFDGAMTCDQVRADYGQTSDLLDFNRDTLVTLDDMMFLMVDWLEIGAFRSV